jgi:hypothetical protein
VPPESELTEDDVRIALDFLVAVEPDPQPATREEYAASSLAHKPRIDRAMETLQCFAQQGQPASLEQMQLEYYGFTNDPRYLTSPLVASVVAAALNAAWHGVGPWRR